MINFNNLLSNKEEELVTLKDVFKRLVALDIYFDIKHNKNKFNHEYLAKNLNHSSVGRGCFYNSFNNCLNNRGLNNALLNTCSNSVSHNGSNNNGSNSGDDGLNNTDSNPNVQQDENNLASSLSNLNDVLSKETKTQTLGEDNSVFSNDNAFTELSSNLSSNVSNIDEFLNELNEEDECFLVYILHDLLPVRMFNEFLNHVMATFGSLGECLNDSLKNYYEDLNEYNNLNEYNGSLNRSETKKTNENLEDYYGESLKLRENLAYLKCFNYLHSYYKSVQNNLIQSILKSKDTLITKFYQAVNYVRHKSSLGKNYQWYKNNLAMTKNNVTECLTDEFGEDVLNSEVLESLVEELKQFFKDLNNVLISLYESKMNLSEVYYLINYYNLDLESLYVNVSTVEYALRMDEKVINYFNINNSNLHKFLGKLSGKSDKFNYEQFHEMFHPKGFFDYNIHSTGSDEEGNKQKANRSYDKKYLINNLLYKNVYGITSDNNLMLDSMYHLEPLPTNFM